MCIDWGVKYINYEAQGFPVSNALNYIMHKRLPFAHERELRAIFWEMDGAPGAQPHKARIEPNGLAIEVDLPALIDRVYVSPKAPSWVAACQRDDGEMRICFPS